MSTSPTVELTADQLLEAVARRRPDAVAVELADGSDRATYAELRRRVGRVASALRRTGLQRGDAVAVWVPNGVDWLALFLAGARLGLLVVPLNTRYKSPEVRHLLGVSGARTLVLQPGFHGIDFVSMSCEALAAPTSVESVVLLGDGEPVARVTERFAPLVSSVHRLHELVSDDEVDDEGRPDDPLVVFGTSGTTSFPKLAVHHQAGASRHVRNVAEAMQLDERDRVLCVLPFCGTYGFVAVMSALASGARAVLLPVFDADEVTRALAEHEITCLFVVEAIMRGLVAPETAGERSDRFPALAKAGVAGIAIRDLVDLADEVLGVRVVNLYGSSELFAMMATWSPDDPPGLRAVAGGRILDDDMHVRAVDPLTRATLPADGSDAASGELEFSGFHVTAGYLANDAANAAAFSDDGWYRSGDRGRVSEGGRVVEYESRLSDTLRLRGYLVSPAEIEELLGTHPDVGLAQVVGVPDPSTGDDRAVAFVLPLAGRGVDADALREHCTARAAAWKVPELFVAVTEFPVTPSANGDKVQKGELRTRAEALLDDAATTTTTATGGGRR